MICQNSLNPPEVGIIYKDILGIKDQSIRKRILEEYFIIECTKGDLEAVKYLHDNYDFDSEVLGKGYQKACQYGNLPIIKFIESVHILYHGNFSWYIASSASADIKVSEYLLSIADKIQLKLDEEIILIQACNNGNIELFDMMMKRKRCQLDCRSLRYACKYPVLFEKIRSEYPEQFNSITTFCPDILLRYYCVTEDFSKFIDLIKTSYDKLSYFFSVIIKQGNIKFITYMLDHYRTLRLPHIHEDEELFSFYFYNVVKRNNPDFFNEFTQIFTSKFPFFKIDFTKLICKVLDNKYFSIISYIMKNYRERINFHSLIEYVYNKHLLDTDNILLHMLEEGYVEYSYMNIIQPLLNVNLIFNIKKDTLINKILSKTNLDGIYKHFYLLKYSCKTNILKRCLNRDIIFFINDF